VRFRHAAPTIFEMAPTRLILDAVASAIWMVAIARHRTSASRFSAIGVSDCSASTEARRLLAGCRRWHLAIPRYNPVRHAHGFMGEGRLKMPLRSATTRFRSHVVLGKCRHPIDPFAPPANGPGPNRGEGRNSAFRRGMGLFHPRGAELVARFTPNAQMVEWLRA